MRLVARRPEDRALTLERLLCCGKLLSRVKAVRVASLYKLSLAGAHAVKLSELYKKKIERMESILKRVRSKPPGFDGTALRALAHEAQSDAGFIAHCIVKFGDQDLEAMPIENLMKSALRVKCVQMNPWARGLRVIQRWIDSSSSTA